MEIETHGIEFIPENERYGTARKLFTIWFSANMQVTALVIGALGVVAGLNLFWSFVAIMLGSLIGSVFMAAHSAQGPHLGIPQMIQSRAQFGVLGAAFPLLIIFISYILFTAANGVIMKSSVQAVLPIGNNAAITVFGVFSLVIAFIGYELIHKMGSTMSILSGILFIVVAVIALRLPFAPGSWSVHKGYDHASFLLELTQAASWSIGFGPYVADYSRYLPRKITTRSTFWNSYIGQAAGTIVVMLIGALLASHLPKLVDEPGGSIASLFGEYKFVPYILIVLGVLELNVLNLYSAYMSGVTIFSGLHGISRVTLWHKLVWMAAIAAVATVIAVMTQYDFNAYFSDILIAQIYFIVPWTAINLTDFYLIRRGVYSIKDIYNEDGIYGRFNMPALTIMALTILVQVPFMKLSFYTGPIANALQADVAWIVALILPAVLYYAVSRRTVVGAAGAL